MEADNLELLTVIELLSNISAGTDVSVDISKVPAPWDSLIERFAKGTRDVHALL